MKKREKKVALVALVISAVIVGAVAVGAVQFSAFATSGFEGIQALCDRVTFAGGTLRPEDPTHFDFDPNVDELAGPNAFLGTPDYAHIKVELDQPKLMRTIDSTTVTVNSSTYSYTTEMRVEEWEWSVDFYALADSGGTSPTGMKFYMRLRANPDAVFGSAAPNKTAMYIIHANVERYEQLGTGNEQMNPSQGAFTLYFVDASGSPPSTVDLTSPWNIDFDALNKFGYVEIVFEIVELAPEGSLWWWTEEHVHYIVSIKTLTIGQWIQPLTTETGGENQAGGSGSVAWWDQLARGMGDVFSSLGAWLQDFWWVIPIVLVAIAIPVTLVVVRMYTWR